MSSTDEVQSVPAEPVAPAAPPADAPAAAPEVAAEVATPAAPASAPEAPAAPAAEAPAPVAEAPAPVAEAPAAPAAEVPPPVAEAPAAPAAEAPAPPTAPTPAPVPPPAPPAPPAPVLMEKPAPLSIASPSATYSSSSSSSASSSSSSLLDDLDVGTPTTGEVAYEAVNMSAARAKFSLSASASVKPGVTDKISPRRPPPTGLGGGAGIPAAGSITGSPVGKLSEGVAGLAVTSPKPSEDPALADVKVYHNKTWYPLKDLILATKKDPGVFEGIDFAAKELLLNEEGFKQVFKMTYDEFSQLGKWKQSTEKKKFGLF